MEGSTITDMLSKSELEVYNYIVEQTSNGDKLRESMKKIGEKLDVSEATVHRAIRKLKKSGVIGIVASQEKAESNAIIYYGVPDVEEESDEIFNMISKLNQRANRFKTLLEQKEVALEQKDAEIARLNSQLKAATEKIEQLSSPEHRLDISIEPLGKKVITSDDIISVTDLGGGTIAYITRE